MHPHSKTIPIGLNLPLFLASLVTLFIGSFTGLIGVWIYLIWKVAVPEYIKVGHAHMAWWSVLILLAAFFLPSLSLKARAKRFIVWTSFLAPVLWQISLAAYYVSKVQRGALDPLAFPDEFGMEYLAYGTGIFVMEVWLFFALALVVLSGIGFHLPFFSQSNPSISKYEFISGIKIPRLIFWFPVVFGLAGLLVGWYMTLAFKALNKPIDPAALVQFHGHLFFFVAGFFLTIMTLKAIGAPELLFRAALWLGYIGIPAIFIGYILFIRMEYHSLVYVLPASLYFLMMILGLLGLIAFCGLEKKEDSFHYIRGCMIFSWSILLVLVSLGAVIALVWDTHPNLTVTYEQPPGEPYPGPYPAEYLGTKDVGMTPRGLENAHLSPGSWFHVAIFWLLTLLIFGEEIFRKLGKRNLLFLMATTIPLAPFFNTVGRFAAWLEIPNGIGALYFAGHPMKMFNMISLIAVTCALLVILKKSETAENYSTLPKEK